MKPFATPLAGPTHSLPLRSQFMYGPNLCLEQLAHIHMFQRVSCFELISTGRDLYHIVVSDAIQSLDAGAHTTLVVIQARLQPFGKLWQVSI
jgi:hypothetical protein